MGREIQVDFERINKSQTIQHLAFNNKITKNKSKISKKEIVGSSKTERTRKYQYK